MVQTYQLPTHFCGGGGKLPNANGPNLPTTNSFLGGGGGGGKLPNANDPNLPTTNSFLGVVVVVNYQMQMVQTYQLPTHIRGDLCFLGVDDMESGRPSFYGLP